MNGALLLVAWLAPVLPAGPQERLREDERHAREAPHSEGVLDNDVFVAVAEGPVAESLAQGDQALLRARAVTLAEERGRLLDLAFDGWQAALATAPAGARLWLAPAGQEARCAESLHAHVLRRLTNLDPVERARYTERFTTRAAGALEEARRAPEDTRSAALLEVARRFPGCPAAAHALLELADRAREAGDLARARACLARGELEAELAGDARLGPAFARRALAPAEAAPGAAWRDARGFSPAGVFAFETRHLATSPERRQRPGAAFLGPGHFVVQSAQELLCFAPRGSDPLAPYARIRPLDLLDGAALVSDEAPREPPGWPLLPAVDGNGVALVVGRALPEDSNVLLLLDLEPPAKNLGLALDLGQSRAAARLRWALVGARWLGPRGSVEVPALEALAPFEFQPGPVLAADRLIVQLRTDTVPVESWLVALDRTDGSLAWLRPMARGADRVNTGRMSRVTRRVAAQPLLAFELADEARVFVGTHLGLGVLVDALDGEPLWSFKCRRRPEHEPGWSGDRPLFAPAGSGGMVLWAPMDSDRLYTLSAQRLADEAGTVLARPPTPLADAQALLGGGPDEHIVTGARGKDRTVSMRRAGLDRIDALDLGEAEFFRGQGLVSERRVWVASNSDLYLFDRERELYKLDSEPLGGPGSASGGGDVFAFEQEVLVVGSGTVWRFTTR